MLRKAAYPILEFDPCKEAMIEPCKVLAKRDVPTHCVMPMLHPVIEKLLAEGVLTQVSQLGTSLGAFPIYRLQYHDCEISVIHPGLGAPLASGILEEMIAIGCRHFVACGGAGVLDGALQRSSVVIPTAAVRDEGTSYHYVAPFA